MIDPGHTPHHGTNETYESFPPKITPTMVGPTLENPNAEEWEFYKNLVIQLFDEMIFRESLIQNSNQQENIPNSPYAIIKEFFYSLYLRYNIHSMQTMEVSMEIAEKVRTPCIRQFVLELQALFVNEVLNRFGNTGNFVAAVTAYSEVFRKDEKDSKTNSLLGFSVNSKLDVPDTFFRGIIRNDLWYGILILLKSNFHKTALINEYVNSLPMASGMVKDKK